MSALPANAPNCACLMNDNGVGGKMTCPGCDSPECASCMRPPAVCENKQPKD